MSLVTDLILMSETSPQASYLYSRQADYSVFPIDQKNISARRDCRGSFIFSYLPSSQIKSKTPKKQLFALSHTSRRRRKLYQESWHLFAIFK